MPLRLGIRDRIARLMTSHHEVEREAWKLLSKDKTIPVYLSPYFLTLPKMAIRIKAQSGLNRFPRYMRPASIRLRCTERGKGAGLIKDYGISRIVFREFAVAGLLPGVRKSS
jgi:small subunit ribosomal protein S14